MIGMIFFNRKGREGRIEIIEQINQDTIQFSRTLRSLWFI